MAVMFTLAGLKMASSNRVEDLTLPQSKSKSVETLISSTNCEMQKCAKQCKDSSVEFFTSGKSLSQLNIGENISNSLIKRDVVSMKDVSKIRIKKSQPKSGEIRGPMVRGNDFLFRI